MPRTACPRPTEEKRRAVIKLLTAELVKLDDSAARPA